MQQEGKSNALLCNIFLIGFMGTGKSTVAKALKKETGAEIIEMDQLIAQRENLSIPKIFEEKGEAYFRNVETELLMELQSGEKTIVSCGGGVPMREKNVLEMKKSGKVVLLTALPETILERVRDNEDRPLLQNRKSVEGIRELMEQRREKYEAAADMMVATDGKSAETIAREILQTIR